MCGIYGIFQPKQYPDKFRKELDSLSVELRHRGPDGHGEVLFDGLCLGNRRLAIISPQSNLQPVCNEDQTIWAVMNGEIYNFSEIRADCSLRHTFKYEGDVETLVHLYEDKGLDFPRWLEGMFAFALWDSHLNRLILGRDRIGEKPLYVWQDCDRVIFASEMTAITRLTQFSFSINELSLVSYLAIGYSPGRESMAADIRKVPPGCIWIFEGTQTPKEHRYWHIPAVQATAYNARKTPTSLADTLQRACKRQFETADVPVGVFLSGGLDSSLITYFLKVSGIDQFNTYTIAYQGVKGSNDLWHAERLASKLGLNFCPVWICPDDLLGVLDDFIAHIDEPCSDPTALSLYLLSRRAVEDVKVVLTGGGADELFAGYADHIRTAQYLQAHTDPTTRHNPLFPIISGLPWDLANALLTPEILSHLDPNVLPGWSAPPVDFSNADAPLWQTLATDLTFRLPDHLLAIGDRMTMAVSLEARTPYLDVRVVEMGMQLPDQAKVLNGENKAILRTIARQVLPEAINTRRKEGFPSPILGPWYEAVVSPFWKKQRGNLHPIFQQYFKLPMVDWVADQASLGNEAMRGMLWKLAVLASWLEKAHIA